VTDAQYYARLSRAVRLSRFEMMWEVSHVEGWHFILAGGILEGGCYMWPDPMLSEAGRQALRLRDLRDEITERGISDMIDL
jgi:hypothetical protein